MDSDFALRDWEANVKALFRQGQVLIFNWQGCIMVAGCCFSSYFYASCWLQAYMALNDIDSGVESFKKALELEPNDGQ